MKASTAYLLSSIANVAAAQNARYPVARTGPVSVPAFASGWVTSEAVAPTIALQGAVTGLFAAKGALKQPAGKVGLGLTLASWASLAAAHRVALRADRVLESALIDGLGADYRSEIAVDEPPLTFAEKFVPSFGDSGNRFATDIEYGPAGKRNSLDIWRSPNLRADARAPVLVQVHGGAWVVGNKEEQARPLMSLLADHGWVCVAINYRLSPKATWPDHIVDVKRALAWTKDNIADFGGDPDFVAITGGSAGGHLSSLAALTPNEPMYQPGFETADTSVVAAVPFYGVYDFTNRDGSGREDMTPLLSDTIFKSTLEEAHTEWDMASTMSRIREDAVPFFILHGSNDSLVPVEQARSFAAMMERGSHESVVYAELPGTQHAFDMFRSPRTVHTIRAVYRFLETIRVRKGHRADDPAG